jgi:hypothetical protein
MDSTTPTEDPRIKQFWDGYFEIILLFRIPENAHAWYQKHDETCIQYCPLPDCLIANRSTSNNG